MGIFDSSLFSWFGKPAQPRSGNAKASRSGSTSTQYAHSHSSTSSQSQHSIRKDLLKVVLRETLIRNGIPASWIGADLLRTTSPRKEPGIHVRLLVRHWDARLLECGVAFEQDFFKRLQAMDPTSGNWLMGISWQYAMEDVSRCPEMPHPGVWTAAPAAAQAQPAPAAAAQAAAGDVIAGPVVIPQPQDDVRADLERLLALRDEDIKRHGKDAFASTQPVQL